MERPVDKINQVLNIPFVTTLNYQKSRYVKPVEFDGCSFNFLNFKPMLPIASLYVRLQ